MNTAQTAAREGNPFPGLRPFKEEEEYLFFGRESQVDALVNRLAATRFLAVVGTSGSGKSSLVNCGLRPALRRGLMARAGTAWRMAQFRPGGIPIRSMARALAQDGVLFRDYEATGLSLVEIIETTLQMSRLGLVDIYEQARLPTDSNLLVVVDQFEELFRYRQSVAVQNQDTCAVGEDETAFVNLLLETRQQTNCSIYVVLTMRSDFLGDCAQFAGLAEAINGGQYLVPRMTRDERRVAITGPAKVGGAEVSPVLLTRLVNDVGDNPDQLSILQHALNRTWARWQFEGGAKELDLPHYEAIGTMAHALDRHAERAYSELETDRQRAICEKLFKALTDKATDPRGVRRPTTLGTLCAITDAPEGDVTAVMEVFRKPSRSFLMPPAGEPLTPSTVIDISHESLMRVWQRLEKWADEEARLAHIYRRLAETAILHRDGHAGLWRSPDLDIALKWRKERTPNAAWGQRYHPAFSEAMAFLEASEAQAHADEEERARVGRIRRTVFAGLLVFLIAGLLDWLVYAQYTAEDETQRQRQKLETQLHDEQEVAARKMHEQRLMRNLFVVGRAHPRDSGRVQDIVDQLQYLEANSPLREIVDKLGLADPLGPDQEALIQLYDALAMDALVEAQSLINGPTKSFAPEQAAWENWVNIKKAEAREWKFIGILYKLTENNASRGIPNETLRFWSSKDQLDINLFVHPVDFELASKLRNSDPLQREEDLLARFDSALESGDVPSALDCLKQLATSYHDTAQAVAAQREWRSVGDRMYISYLSRQVDALEPSEAGESRAVSRWLDQGGVVEKPLKSLVGWVGVFSQGPTDSKAIEAAYADRYRNQNLELEPSAFANPVHFAIASKLTACANQGTRCALTKSSTEPEGKLLGIYDALEREAKAPATATLDSFDKHSAHYLLAASALGDPEPPTRQSVFAKIAGWLDELKALIAVLLIWPAWEGFRWIQKRRGNRVTIKLRANPIRRLLAGLTDIWVGVAFGCALGSLVGAVCWMIVGVASGTYMDTAENTGLLVGRVAFACGSGGYLLFRDAIKYRFRRSLGKILFSLRPIMIGPADRAVTMKVSAERNALLVLGCVIPFVLPATNFLFFLFVIFLLQIFVLVDLILTMIKDGRTLHDRIGKTRVIDIRSDEAKAFERR